MNIFENPKKYLNELLTKVKITNPKVRSGKSLAAVFFTKICEVECPFCFYKSSKQSSVDIIQKQEYTEQGFKNLIKFINESNLETLLISGGGEPFEKPEYVLKTLEQAQADKIILITSGYWANNYHKTEQFLLNAAKIINNRKNKTKVVLRISVDASHISRIGDDKILNIIRVFENNFCQDDKFNLQIHTIENDKSVDKIIDKTGSRKILYNKNNEIIKNLNRYVLVTPRNLNIQVESAKLFNSDLKVDVHDSVKNNMAKNVFLKDLIESQDGSFSLYKDQSGELGLDYYINYNGNVSTWGNYQRFNVPNLYIHSPNEIKQSLYSDPVSYSFIDKNFLDILKIVNKVSPEAVNRSILINIRDFSGSYLLEEDKTCLYYGIEVVKEYISRGLIDKINLDKLSLELKKSLNMSEKELIKSYNDSLYDIFSQLQQGTFIKEKWDDVFELINLGHYKVSEMRENMAKEYYRNQTGLDYQFIESKKIDPKQQSRLLEKLCPINSEAENLLKNQYQNNTDDVIDKIRD